MFGKGSRDFFARSLRLRLPMPRWREEWGLFLDMFFSLLICLGSKPAVGE